MAVTFSAIVRTSARMRFSRASASNTRNRSRSFGSTCAMRRRIARTADRAFSTRSTWFSRSSTTVPLALRTEYRRVVSSNVTSPFDRLAIREVDDVGPQRDGSTRQEQPDEEGLDARGKQRESGIRSLWLAGFVARHGDRLCSGRRRRGPSKTQYTPDAAETTVIAQCVTEPGRHEASSERSQGGTKKHERPLDSAPRRLTFEIRTALVRCITVPPAGRFSGGHSPTLSSIHHATNERTPSRRKRQSTQDRRTRARSE